MALDIRPRENVNIFRLFFTDVPPLSLSLSVYANGYLARNFFPSPHSSCPGVWATGHLLIGLTCFLLLHTHTHTHVARNGSVHFSSSKLGHLHAYLLLFNIIVVDGYQFKTKHTVDRFYTNNVWIII